MAGTRAYAAIDLGAESGRAMLAAFDGSRLSLSEVYRFANRPVRVLDHLHWNVLGLFQDIKAGLARIAAQVGPHISSLGVDTWGVDFALLSRSGGLLGMPFHYRDNRTQGMLDAAFRLAPRAEIFAQTGIQFMEINTLYQLLAMVEHDPQVLSGADVLLMIPDLFNYWLTGEKACELTIATTTQCYDPRRRDWAVSMLERLGIPGRIFLKPIPPGTVLGRLAASVREETQLGAVPVVAPACHDTGSAVAAVPAQNADFAYISSGTWSVVGAELAEPVINDQTLAWNFTNEGGVCGTTRLLRNVAGLWLVQQCREFWARQGEDYSYAELAQMAAQAPALQAVVDPDHADFMRPGDMPALVQAYCRRTGQTVPQTTGEIVRVVLEGLALKYRLQLERLEQIVGRRLAPVHIVGGGTQNRLLNQLTADALGRTVLAGPVEATALGNALLQAIALGDLASLDEGRALVQQSFPIDVYEPRTERQDDWAQALARLKGMLGS